MPNPYDSINLGGTTGGSNPYSTSNLSGKNLTGFTPEPIPKSHFAILQEGIEDSKEKKKKADEYKGFVNLTKKTLNPINLAKGAWDVASTAVMHPIETAKNAALGLSNGLTLGATDWLQRKAFTDAAKGSGMTDEEIKSAAENFLQPEDPTQRAIRGGANFAGIVAPYAAIEQLLIRGSAYAAPAFVAKYGKLSKLLVDIGAFNAAGQIEESFRGATGEERLKRAALDTVTAGLFNAAGGIYRTIRGTQFKSPFNVNPANPGGPKNEAEIVRDVYRNMVDGIKHDEGAAAKALSGIDPAKYASLDDLKHAIDTVIPPSSQSPAVKMSIERWIAQGKQLKDFYLAGNESNPSIGLGIVKDGEVITQEMLNAAKGDAKVAVTAQIGGKPTTVITNDINALQDYIKGSNKIDYKQVKTLGRDAKGNEIQARFEARGGVDGRPIIYTTDQTTASNLAHELGHYFDNELTASVDKKLSTLLPDFEKNRPLIEDTLSSLAVERLGGKATYERISTEVNKIASELKREIDTLSSNRRGALIPSRSERFADAVSEVLTKEGASAESPTLTALLKQSERLDTARLFGENVAKELKTIKTPAVPDNVVTVEGKTFELSGEAKAKYQQAKQMSDAHVESIKSVTRADQQGALLKGEGMRMAALKRELTGQYTATELANAVKKEQSNYLGKKIEVEINGKKVEAEIASRSAFGNTKVKLENGDIISVKNSAITPDNRPVGEIVKKVTDRPESKPYEPGVIKQALETKKEPKVETKVVEKEKVVEKAPELDRTPTGKKPETEAIKADKITSDAETEAFINTKVLPKITGKERIGKSDADIIERSYSSTLTEESFDNILKERFGNLSEDIVKAKRIMTDGASNLKETLAGRSIDDLSGEELKTVMSDYNRLVQTFEVFSGVRTELSNSFRSLGTTVAPGENDILRSALETIQKAIGSEKDPFQIMKKVIAVQEKGPVAKYFEVWYPAILSGPKTSVRNIVGNTANLTMQTLSKLFTKQGRSEFLPTVNGIIAGQKEALNKAIAVMKGESMITSKIVEGEALQTKTFKGKLAFLNNVEYVGRFLNAQDAYFSSIAKDGEIAGIRAGAIDYGLKDKVLIDTLNDAVGQGYAQMATFRNNFEKTFVGEIASKAAALKQSDNAAVKSFANFFVPFVKTIANVTDRRIDFLPIFNLARTFGSRNLYEQRASRILADNGFYAKMLKNGEAEGMMGSKARDFANGEVARVKEIIIDRLRNQQMGRFYMGTTVMAAGIPLAVAGRITGSGPESKNERDTLMASGWRPNSIIMPDGTALPYQNLTGPISSVLSVLGNISDAVKYKTDKKTVSGAMTEGFFKYMNSELDQSFLSGMSNLYDGLTGYTPKEQVIANFVANAIPIPALWTQSKDILFPERYNAKKFNEVIRNKLGITGEVFGLPALQPNLNAFGEQVKADLIYGLTPPILNSKKDDPVLNFMLDNGISIGRPQAATKISGRRGEKRELTPEEYTTYAKNSGAKVYDELKRKIESGYFNRFKTEAEKKSEMDKIVTEIRNKEKEKIRY